MTPYDRYLAKEAGFFGNLAITGKGGVTLAQSALARKGTQLSTIGKGGVTLAQSALAPRHNSWLAGQYGEFAGAGYRGTGLSKWQRTKARASDMFMPGNSGKKLLLSHQAGQTAAAWLPPKTPDLGQVGNRPMLTGGIIAAGGLGALMLSEHRRQKYAGISEALDDVRRDRAIRNEQIKAAARHEIEKKAFQITRPVDLRGSGTQTPSPFPEDSSGHAMTGLRGARDGDLGIIALARYLRIANPGDLDPVALSFLSHSIGRPLARRF